MTGLISDLIGIIDTNSTLTEAQRDSLAGEILN
jgi:hypothetical protein